MFNATKILILKKIHKKIVITIIVQFLIFVIKIKKQDQIDQKIFALIIINK